MVNENRLDPKLVEEFLKFGKNMVDAPKHVPAPDEIVLDVTPHDVVYNEDKVRLLHYKSRTDKQTKTPLVISYALINSIIFWIFILERVGFEIYLIKELMCTWLIGELQQIWTSI